ncbi:hypothetical protein [Deinococcus sp.]|uniref:hypothetical protein n=1 Tax=Deinococcus sp. TaxID=47478 RepID=UPI00286E077C|nr:hypothetical protein [Deinococcus sp.]
MSLSGPDHRRRAGDVRTGGASGQQESGQQESGQQESGQQESGRRNPASPGHTSQEGASQEGAFTERRRRDGLGLLPPARTPEQRYRRERANRIGGFVLVLIGSFVVGGSLALLQGQFGPEFGFSLTLGLLILSQGLWLLGRRERRKHSRQDRRK